MLFLLKNDLKTPPNKSLLCKNPSFDHFHNFFQFIGQIKNQNDLSSGDDYFLEWSVLADYCYLVNGANLWRPSCLCVMWKGTMSTCLPTYLPTYLVRTITYCDLPPNERTEQSSTEQNWFESDRWMKSIHSFACFILSSFPAAPITTLLLSLRFCVQFLCAVLVAVMQLRKLSGCGAFFPLRQHFTQVQSCRSSSSHQIHFHFVIVFFFLIPLAFPFKKEKTFSCCGFLHCFLCPFCSQICTPSS